MLLLVVKVMSLSVIFPSCIVKQLAKFPQFNVTLVLPCTVTATALENDKAVAIL
jgi:hypothetical protein